MTTSDTPETDAAVVASGGDWSPVLRETCRRLERERDQWAAMCGQYKQERDEAITRRMETIMQCELYEQERDKARELVKYYQEYSKLFICEINDTAELAHVCGWRSNRYEPGKVLREKIKQLEEAK